MGPHPAVAAIRLAVRRVLHDVLVDFPTSPPPQPALASAPALTGGAAPLVLVACSGGADSMALASALAFEAPKLGLRAGGVTVDHGLQAGSDVRAAEVAERLRLLGLEPVESVAVSVGREGGPEAAARDARYAALDAAAERHGAVAVLLGHTRDDQAETVLLGLARGSGIRSLSGMAQVSGAQGRYRRPFLRLDRQTVRRACLAQSLPVWDDPHNVDPAYTRSRVRHEALPVLEKALGKGVVEALARTAQLSRDDADALDAWAARAEAEVRTDLPPAGAAPAATASTGRASTDRASAGTAGAGGAPAPGTDLVELDAVGLHALPTAVRRRVLRRAAIAAGAPAGSLFARHIEEVDRLITGWRGQRPLNLPGRVEVRREGGRLVIRQG
ncbi:tRNA lysidine(34) synthetase TilS [Streptomyces sparsogenes]|uniref:tRNA(Ile)-lysidine synthase n=1 Tax=Streptomyces sparsogenes DSM 40356 TaxID=1331668 RepID=A0A1R1SJJ0_9ACTN|nr:tRNA lysidine(34) synthetase TilS [Streptomyces sparsogenes]OMI38462.1 tRNA(Ile)-lysidine synthase [Streptomyces sparsogenes DSM 40356]